MNKYQASSVVVQVKELLFSLVDADFLSQDDLHSLLTVINKNPLPYGTCPLCGGDLFYTHQDDYKGTCHDCGYYDRYPYL